LFPKNAAQSFRNGPVATTQPGCYHRRGGEVIEYNLRARVGPRSEIGNTIAQHLDVRKNVRTHESSFSFLTKRGLDRLLLAGPLDPPAHRAIQKNDFGIH